MYFAQTYSANFVMRFHILINTYGRIILKTNLSRSRTLEYNFASWLQI